MLLTTTQAAAWSRSDLARLSAHFRQHNVLRVGSVARRLVWSTPELLRLRALLHSALRPSRSVDSIASHLQETMLRFVRAKHGPGAPAPAYVGLQLPLGTGWSEYCRQERRQLEILSADAADTPRGGAAWGATGARDGGGDGRRGRRGDSAAAAGAPEVVGLANTAVGERGSSLGALGGGSAPPPCDASAEYVTSVLEEYQIGDVSRVLYIASALTHSPAPTHPVHRQCAHTHPPTRALCASPVRTSPRAAATRNATTMNRICSRATVLLVWVGA